MCHIFVTDRAEVGGDGRRPPCHADALRPATVILAVMIASAWARLPLNAVAQSSVTPPAAASAAPLVAEPQHAVLVSGPSDSRRIWLESLEPAQVVFRDAPGAEPPQTLPARTGRRLAVELVGGDVFAVNPRTGRFDRLVPLTGRFAGDATAESESTLHTQIAEGTGSDASEALREALRAAVRQAVGVYVDSETLTSRDDVVSDRIITYSDAFVARYEELSRATADGLVTVRISADIQARKLTEELRKVKVGTIDVVGQDLVAAAVTRQEAKDAAADLVRRKFEQLLNVLVARSLPFKPLDYDVTTRRLAVAYILEADEKRYRAFLDELLPLLDQAALAQGRLLVKMNPVWSDAHEPFAPEGSGRRAVAGQYVYNTEFRYGPTLARYPKSWCLWLLTRWDAGYRNAQWRAFAMDMDLPRTLGQFTGKVRVRLDLVDAAGGVVHSELHDPLAGMPRPAFWFGWARPRPRAFLPRQPPAPGSLPTAPLLKTTFREPEFAVHETLTVNAYVSPLCFCVPTDAAAGTAVVSASAWQMCHIDIAPDVLARAVSVKCTPEFVPLDAPGGEEASR
jgi:hypothetical protein